ncbi:GerW family sporulation protein [Desulfosporosinus sp. BICA1-9]|uniref:GerW family sporulation protein n=1 Tax=Desulfosporosinus sp. BICA1-9 TaxID=1531958 RepID=UPI00054C0147|nr:spore germination protein GerW family protein [Desulfosporosinus sp. BICA1-9]KJS47963.1 MAG: sporulation protein [Peptococcaceae bacterium BRH_c23]KJS88790.1 MAG: sporulation protein [Desulfosporosinus sp. BICA1-9]HBW34039.1 sporulation protein [Desulfosporosinus sp.]
MSDNFSINESISTLFEKLEDFVRTKTVVGEPFTVGETTIIPFIDISFGLGTGGGGGTDEKGNKGTGGGAGSGAKISPSAILVIKGDNVELLPIKKAGSLEKLIDMVPGIVEKVKDHKCCE